MAKPSPKYIKDHEHILRGFLQKPRSKKALESLAVRHGWSVRSTVGWVNQQVREGRVTQHQTGGEVLYQAEVSAFVEIPLPSVYPRWLDPRTLPVCRSRLVYREGEVIDPDK